MKLLTEYAENQKKKLYEVLKKSEAFLKQAPRGLLRISKKKTRYQFFKTDGVNNKKRIYITRKNIVIARNLAQRDYLNKLLPQLKKNLNILDKFIKTCNSKNLENCYSALSPARKTLVSPFFIDDETYARQWQNQVFERKKEQPEEPLLTMKNESVRSKSEVIIANLLNTRNIPYHYEYPVVTCQGVTLHPDFLCLNKRTRQEFYWEHCGFMSDPEYTENLVWRLSEYSNNGIIPGKNLILTMETARIHLSTKYVESIIQEFLE